MGFATKCYYYCTLWNDFDDKAALEIAINAWITNPTTAETTYGHISTWDVSKVTDMSDLFLNESSDMVCI